MDMVQRSFKALGIGSFIYLLVLLFNNGAVVDTSAIVYVFLLSIFVGISSYIFNVDALNFMVCLLIHYLTVNIFVIVANKMMGYSGSYSHLLTSIFLIYLLAYIVATVNTKITVKELNQQLEKLNNKS
ncbi:DUF3021 domain-containing protein [Lactococcus piscium]|uniref:DUF3021 family protein n=1 Tax=Pseudolactococcus carnosus TaxID=2749961 RepID=UPI001FBAB38F|nr:DUF3021 family protein [Lactococcus carnosus]MCJ1996986.1 DUF3021 domain-containing protein [Lactococcus carnosus]